MSRLIRLPDLRINLTEFPTFKHIARRLRGVVFGMLFCVCLSVLPSANADYSASDGVADSLILQSQASRFLAQASMGGSTAEIATLANRIKQIGALPAFEEWIDHQFELPRTTRLTDQFWTMLDNDNVSYIKNHSVGHWPLVWWSQAIQSPDQLRHKMAFALSQIFVVSMNQWQGLYRRRFVKSIEYYDMLMDNAFSTHRALMHDVTYSPMMGVYLSHAQNFNDPDNNIFADDNYAREVMQLFSIGVFAQTAWGDTIDDNDGNPVENFDSNDVYEFAKVFTGLSINDRRPFLRKNLTLLGSGPMIMNNNWHDRSSKRLLNGTVLPAGQAGETDIAMALDNLAEHPSTAPNMARLLIQRFTHSSPTRGYIKRVSDAWTGVGPYGTGVVGDFKAVLKAILLDRSVRDSVGYSKESNGSQAVVRVKADKVWAGKIKEPILKMTNFYRFAKPVSASSDGHLRIGGGNRAVGQEILWAQTVFNFYDAAHAPSDGPIGQARENQDANGKAVKDVFLTSPEAQILSENVVREFNRFYNLPLSGRADNSATRTSLENINGIKNEAMPDEALIRYVDVMLCHGQLPYELGLEFKDMLGRSESELSDSGDTYSDKFADIISVIFASPACSVIM